jgi:hypothetical protein
LVFKKMIVTSVQLVLNLMIMNPTQNRRIHDHRNWHRLVTRLHSNTYRNWQMNWQGHFKMAWLER